MKKVKEGLDCVTMTHAIQEQLAKEMKGMTAKERLRYIKRQVQQSPFADEIRGSISLTLAQRAMIEIAIGRCLLGIYGEDAPNVTAGQELGQPQRIK